MTGWFPETWYFQVFQNYHLDTRVSLQVFVLVFKYQAVNKTQFMWTLVIEDDYKSKQNDHSGLTVGK